MRLFVSWALVALAAGPATAEDPKAKPEVTVEKLVGKWKLVKTDAELPKGMTAFVELTKDEKITIRLVPADADAETIVLKGKYTLKDGKIDYAVTLPSLDEKQEALTVKKLTADEVVWEDPKGISETFNRVPPEKKKDKSP